MILVFHSDWKSARDTLHSIHNFPEFTGRIRPAPCEAACTLIDPVVFNFDLLRIPSRKDDASIQYEKAPARGEAREARAGLPIAQIGSNVRRYCGADRVESRGRVQSLQAAA